MYEGFVSLDRIGARLRTPWGNEYGRGVKIKFLDNLKKIYIPKVFFQNNNRNLESLKTKSKDEI